MRRAGTVLCAGALAWASVLSAGAEVASAGGGKIGTAPGAGRVGLEAQFSQCDPLGNYLVGDSIGMDAQTALSSTFTVDGIGGRTLQAGIDAVRADQYLWGSADNIVIELGTNYSAGAETSARRLYRLLHRRNPSARMYWLGVFADRGFFEPGHPGYPRYLNASLKAMSGRHRSLTFVNPARFKAKVSTIDGTHPDAEGALDLARIVRRVVIPHCH